MSVKDVEQHRSGLSQSGSVPGACGPEVRAPSKPCQLLPSPSSDFAYAIMTRK